MFTLNICVGIRGGALVSEEKKDDQPLFKLEKQTLSIMTMELAEMVLRTAGDKKITELRLCLEGNVLNSVCYRICFG